MRATATPEVRLNRQTQAAPSINISRLLGTSALERSEIVANACMNRERNLSGANSYEADLGLDPLEFLVKILERQGEASWLDLCCGTGRALLQAAGTIERNGLASQIQLLGVDLVPMFDRIPAGLSWIRLVSASVERWDTEERFDLITCVHGLHYVGDKLRLLQRASRWIRGGGLLLVHLDYRNLRIADKKQSGSQIGRDLHRAGFHYLKGRHLLTREGSTSYNALPYRYLGADDKAGPNYTGQAAIDSYYERIKV
jgi:SAM-dependent methyltransferase